MTQRTKSKFVFAGAGKTAETLFKLVNILELVLCQFGSVECCDIEIYHDGACLYFSKQIHIS